jgi:hypothetical protein
VQILFAMADVVEFAGLLCDYFFAHEEHWRSRGKHRQAESNAASRFGETPRRPN